jgi:antitoxin component YwqK of YwqJK toxin-antitoxin module
VLYSNSGARIYEGLMLDRNIREGYGVEYHPQSAHKPKELNPPKEVESYIGDFKDNKRDGYGREFYQSTKTVKFEGYWKSGLKHGQQCEYSQTGERIFEGDYKSDSRDGKGSEYFRSGILCKFESNYRGNKKHGAGTEYFANGNINYKGEFLRDLYNGLGVQNYLGGSIKFQGEFCDGQKSGFGWSYDIFGEITIKASYIKDRIEKLQYIKTNEKFLGFMTKYYKDTIYIGQISTKDGNRDGLGIEVDYSGYKIYEGDWANGMPHGHGIEYRNNGTVNYVGQWKVGVKNGPGKILLQNGSVRYHGQFSNNEYFGLGVLYGLNRNVQIKEYEGEWKWHQKNGRGKQYWNDGKCDDGVKCIGEFVDDKFRDNGVQFWQNGKVNL